MEPKVKKGLLVFIFIILLLPLVQQCFPFITSGQLEGSYTDAKEVAFSWGKWADASYQKGKTDFCNDHVGFRPDLLRINNQIDFSLFGDCHAVWAVLGTHDCLFQDVYINAIYGQNFIGYPAIRERAIKLKAIQDTMARLGKLFVLVYGPNKARFYPENFPKNRMHDSRGVTNFEVYRKMGDSLGINQIDMNSWFVSMKNKLKDSLFAKQGIHWTVYGAILAGDSLMTYIEKAMHRHIPHPKCSKMERSTEPRSGDDDVERSINIIFPVTTETFTYPVIEDVPDSGCIKPNVIYLGDSYAFKMIVYGIVNRMNRNCEYWGYFEDVRGFNIYKWAYIKDYDWKKALDENDCLVMLYTEFNLWQLGNGFIESAYDYYYPAGKK
jgi:hypothetical protein